MKIKYSFFLLFALLVSHTMIAQSAKKGSSKIIKTLIVDGQNNHDQWPKVTYMMKQYLEETGKFSVDVQRSRYTWKGDAFLQDFAIAGMVATESLPKSKEDSDFHPNFSNYDVVICNFGWNAAPWSAVTQTDFEKFIKNGGGLVVVHAADNSFPEWLAYNKMIGLGGWGNRTEKDGPYVYYDDKDKLVRDTTAGNAGAHGAQSEFLITIRNAKHPITKGMPLKWMHTKDEMYNHLRGPAENMTVLATAFASKSNKGTDHNEPMLMAINYGKGKVFHTTLGHVDYSVECVGFITTLLRGTQWAAGRKVDIPIPTDFPTETAVSKRAFVKK